MKQHITKTLILATLFIVTCIWFQFTRAKFRAKIEYNIQIPKNAKIECVSYGISRVLTLLSINQTFERGSDLILIIEKVDLINLLKQFHKYSQPMGKSWSINEIIKANKKQFLHFEISSKALGDYFNITIEKKEFNLFKVKLSSVWT